MKAQLSLEFMVYIAAGIASLMIVLAAADPALASMNIESTSSYISAIVAEVNANAAFPESSFAAYIPKGICDASINQSAIAYEGTAYRFLNNISIAKGLCSYAGSLRTMELTLVQNGTLALRVVR